MHKKGLVYNYNKRSKIHRHTYPIITKKLLFKAYLKAQSAMEYLLTYGWAILIIAVVLGALFQLGVFNANNFAPKAPPGSCQVFRPYGPGTTQFINLEGICSGELPQYVAQFNGQNSGITITTPKLFPSGYEPGISIFAWVKTTRSSEGVFEYYSPSNNICNGSVRLEINPSPLADFSCDAVCNGPAVNNNNWYFIGWTLSSGSANVMFYVNGVGYGPDSITPINIPTTGLVGLIGAPYPGWAYYNGMLANVQLYNTSLSANEIQALYQEGIGGAPIDLQHLVGWWPLNGNANDYSGNGNNGVPTNVKFVSNWWSGYTPP
jgi:hypothetical protein